MSADQFVVASYRGLDLGGRLKLFDFGPTTAHLEIPTPLPNDTSLELLTDAGLHIAVTVVRVHEQVGGSDIAPGMRVRADGLSGDAKDWWAGLVGGDDPAIPKPPVVVGPLSVREPAPKAKPPGDDAVPEMIDTQVTTPIEAEKSTKKTQIMDVAAINAAIGDDDSSAPADDPSDTNKNKKKKRRRKRSKR